MRLISWLFPLFATSPTGSYTPYRVDCPGNQITRSSTTGINPSEEIYISNRNKVAKSHLKSFLKGANLTDFNVDEFLATDQPVIGLAFSGGGYRAMLSGAGELSALDSRTSGSSLSGLLQASTYVTGLSGGSWLIGSLASNDFPSIDQIIYENRLWNLEYSILAYYGINVIANKLMWVKISSQVFGKQMAGFDSSLTDPWGRALSYQLLSAFKDNGASYLWSDVRNSPSFKKYTMPYPIISAIAKKPGTSSNSLNSIVFEFTPYEMGSWDPNLKAFVDTKFLGSELDNGVSMTGRCVNGFDNAGFIMGTSSTILNKAITRLTSMLGLPSFLLGLIQQFTPIERLNVANYHPNPFYKSNNPGTSLEASDTLYLVDGAIDGQNIPLVSLLNRKVDIIFAHDNSDDIDCWPDGTSLIATYERQFSKQGENIAFPYVPDQRTFRNLNLTAKPTFFGCDAKNLSSLTDDIYNVPVVVYLPNRPFSYWSNTNNFKLVYSDSERKAMIRNGYEISTRKNGTLDSEWATCIACAVIRRQQERTDQKQSKQCQKCFKKYCWDGTIYDGPELGNNFSDEGLTESDEYYNEKNTPGYYNGGINFF